MNRQKQIGTEGRSEELRGAKRNTRESPDVS